jgi:hypothetical protein
MPDGTAVSRDATLGDLEHVSGATETVGLWHTSSAGSADIMLWPSEDRFFLRISVPSTKLLMPLHDAITSSLDLAPAPPRAASPDVDERVAATVGERTAELSTRIGSLEVAFAARSRRLQCFLSFRFTDANELISLRLQQFLSLLEVDVVTGATYEPRQVTEKVLSRLAGPLDLIILLVTSDGESMWTRDEIGAAIHKNLALVPIIEKGASLEPRLFGDVEYIEYTPGHIGDAFLKLLQAIVFVRQQTPAGSA